MTRELAQEIATNAHSGQFRKNTGEPYISHPIAVAKIAEQLYLENTTSDPHDREVIARKIWIVGVLHDVIEDTDVTFETISSAFPDVHILEALNILTRKKDQTYFDFIKNIVEKGSVIARTVKIADITHNMSDLHEGSLKDKYRFALHMLKNTKSL